MRSLGTTSWLLLSGRVWRLALCRLVVLLSLLSTLCVVHSVFVRCSNSGTLYSTAEYCTRPLGHYRITETLYHYNGCIVTRVNGMFVLGNLFGRARHWKRWTIRELGKKYARKAKLRRIVRVSVRHELEPRHRWARVYHAVRVQFQIEASQN